FGPPMSMIRHRFGGNLRAVRASIPRRRPSRTALAISPATSANQRRCPGATHRAADSRVGGGRSAVEAAPTEVVPGPPGRQAFEEERLNETPQGWRDRPRG